MTVLYGKFTKLTLTLACHHPLVLPDQSHQFWRPCPHQGTCYLVWDHDVSHVDCECSLLLLQADTGSIAPRVLLWHFGASEHVLMTESTEINSVFSALWKSSHDKW